MKWIKRPLLSLIFVVILAHAYSNAPGAEIKGTVIGNTALQPLEYATVSLISLPDSVNVDNTVTETIESIEIITNPSVKYEAKGTSGIFHQPI